MNSAATASRDAASALGSKAFQCRRRPRRRNSADTDKSAGEGAGGTYGDRRDDGATLFSGRA